ncbi:hypothetical protein TSUD_211550 [Trifolium subterraneum]|uniref:Transmembrane protein n=1 Tax=Trifolium subterraneum TaxID=3900 RepID=A0A2Z6P0Q3_TRISU|nr:hypothetical protein TSUD_211550 [Trifolium subterraneum]
MDRRRNGRRVKKFVIEVVKVKDEMLQFLSWATGFTSVGMPQMWWLKFIQSRWGCFVSGVCRIVLCSWVVVDMLFGIRVIY